MPEPEITYWLELDLELIDELFEIDPEGNLQDIIRSLLKCWRANT